MSDTAKLTRIARTPEQKAEEKRIRELHRLNPVRDVPSDVLRGSDVADLLKFVAAVRREREALGMSLEELAQRTEVDVAELTRFESGQAFNPTISTLFRIAGALGRHLTLALEPTGRTDV